MYTVPSKVYQPRQCDEKPDDFRKLGLGVCFQGSDKTSLNVSKIGFYATTQGA